MSLMSVWMSVFGILTIGVSIFSAWLGHKAGSKGKDHEVALAKELTEKETRQKIAEQSALDAERVRTDAMLGRRSTDAQAKATADQGDEALNQALKDQGQLRD